MRANDFEMLRFDIANVSKMLPNVPGLMNPPLDRIEAEVARLRDVAEQRRRRVFELEGSYDRLYVENERLRAVITATEEDWGQRVEKFRAKVNELKDEVERLRAALHEIAKSSLTATNLRVLARRALEGSSDE